MPVIKDQKAAKAHVNAWRTALPSHVVDSFYQLYDPSNSNTPQLGRVIGFEVDQVDLKMLSQDDGSHLEIDYGFDQADLGSEQSAFKMYLRSVGGSGEKSLSKYHSMKSLTVHNLKEDYPESIMKSFFAHNIGNNVQTMNTAGEIPNEYISPTIEQWLFYAWRNCETAKLVDQVEAMYKGSRVRIEKSIFDANVTQAIANYESDNNESTIYTFVLLALHQVIPGDLRIFPFGPILLSFIVPESQKLLNSNDAQPIEPEGYELTIPCPPSC